jgi:molybdenum-dependent DNA-binding transcriptional regulator ModE
VRLAPGRRYEQLLLRSCVIETQPGGAHGATLTAFGQKLVERYRAIEADALVATREHLRDIEIALRAGEATRR